MLLLITYIFDGDEMLIARQELYCINDIIEFSWINDLFAYVFKIEFKNNKRLYQYIDRLTIEKFHEIT